MTPGIVAVPGRATRTVDDDVLLDVRDLTVLLGPGSAPARAVDHVSLSLRTGSTLGLVGESGCGKTTLVRSIMGLLPADARRTGEVRYRGTDLCSLGAAELRRLWGAQIGMVFQDPMTSLNPVRTVGAQLGVPLRRHRHLRGRARRDAAVELLRTVGIPEPGRRVDQYPHELSGGMCQRVVIAVALAAGPSLLLADEPTTALDATVQRQILSLLAEQRAMRAMAMVVVTHDLGVVAALADDIAVMYAGKVVETAPTAELLAAPRMPYTHALMQAVPRLSAPARSRLSVVPGRPPDLTALPLGCRFASRCDRADEHCRAVEPALMPVPGDAGHLVACWHPVDPPLVRAAGEGGVTRPADPECTVGSPR